MTNFPPLRRMRLSPSVAYRFTMTYDSSLTHLVPLQHVSRVWSNQKSQRPVCCNLWTRTYTCRMRPQASNSTTDSGTQENM